MFELLLIAGESCLCILYISYIRFSIYNNLYRKFIMCFFPIILCINNYRVDDVRNKSFTGICLHVFLTNYSFGANTSRQPSSLQLPRGQPLQSRGVVCHSCPVHSNFSSLGDDISQRQPISLTPQQRFELMFRGPSHYFIIPPQTDRQFRSYSKHTSDKKYRN